MATSIRLPACVIPLTETFQETGSSSCAICAHPPATFFIIRSRQARSAESLGGQTPARESESSSPHSLLEPRGLSLFICAVQSESSAITNDAPSTYLFQPCFSSAPQWPAILESSRWSPHTPTSLEALLPASWPLLTCQGCLKEGQCSVKWPGTCLPNSCTSTNIPFSVPGDSSILSRHRMQHTQPLVLQAPVSTHCLRSMCSVPPPTLFVIALFTYTVLQWSRCTCPLSNYLATECLPWWMSL